MTATNWYSNPVFWGIVLLFLINVLNAIVPFLGGAVLAIINAVIGTLTYVSHLSVVQDSVQSALASANNPSAK